MARITVKQLLNHTSGICPEATGAPNDGKSESLSGSQWRPDENGKPRCSWRVSILPFMDTSSTYNSYNFSVTWVHPSNSTAINRRMYVYSCPSEPLEPGKENFTSFLMVTGPATFYDPGRSAVTRR